VNRLADKVALLSGATGGIGRATAELFVRPGARVVMSGRDGDALAAAAKPFGPAALCVVGDVIDPSTAERAVAAAMEHFGGLHVLFANAGMEGRVAPLMDQQLEDVERVLRVNVLGVFLFIKHAAPYIARSGGGSIVITSSIGGVIGSPGMGPYIASKHAVLGLMKTAAIELAPVGIRVNAVNPGPIDNRMMRSIEDQAAPGHGDAVKAGFEKQILLGRYGTNEEVARAALFLASDESSFTTGSTLMADGGFTAV
jgi:NAD(P)-dependent dehydrogenase (short-subunit alcohol dehydrogenase family)